MTTHILLTGATSGIGLDTARLLAKKTANDDVELILANRNLAKAEQVKSELSKITQNPISLVTVDFDDLASVKSCAEDIASKYEKIDILINNAGLFIPNEQETKNGYEKHIGVNFIAPFLFTEKLIPNLTNADKARIVHVASMAHLMAKEGIQFEEFTGFNHFNATRAYGHSKLGNLLYAKALAKQLKSNPSTAHISSNAMHPGGAASSIYRDMPAPLRKFMGLISISTKKSAKRIVEMALDEKWAKKTGEYTSVQTPAWQSKFAKDTQLADELVSHTRKLVADYL